MTEFINNILIDGKDLLIGNDLLLFFYSFILLFLSNNNDNI